MLLDTRRGFYFKVGAWRDIFFVNWYSFVISYWLIVGWWVQVGCTYEVDADVFFHSSHVVEWIFVRG